MSEKGTLIFVAVFEGPIILLKICEVHLQVPSLHTLSKSAIFVMNKCICVWQEKG